MRRAIFGVVLAAIAVAIAWWVAGLPGQVAAGIAGVSIETSLPVGILLLGLLFLVLYAVVRLLVTIIRLPARLRRWDAARRRRQGDEAVTRTLIALAAGEATDARREAGRARRLLGDTPQTLLLAAESARRLGRTEEAGEAFQRLADRRDARFLGLRGLIRQAEAAGDWDSAARLAQQAEEAHPGSDWLRTERAQLALRAGRWRDALALAPPGMPKAAVAAAAADAEPDADTARRFARQAFEAEPGLAPAALAYARRLREQGRESRAQDVIRRAWAANPHPDLWRFALAPVTGELARMQAAQRLAQENPRSAETHLMLAEIALDGDLTGEARRHIEAARATGLDQRRLWTLAARIAVGEGDAAFRSEALARAAEAGPDPEWRCASCFTPAPAWRPACPACHRAGTVQWASAPAKPVALPLDPAPSDRPRGPIA